MDDIRTVMDTAGSERAAIFGFSEGGSMGLLFAATHPDRTNGLILWGTPVRGFADPDDPEVRASQRRYMLLGGSPAISE